MVTSGNRNEEDRCDLDGSDLDGSYFVSSSESDSSSSDELDVRPKQRNTTDSAARSRVQLENPEHDGRGFAVRQ